MKKYKYQVFIFWFAFSVFITCLYGIFYLASIGKLGDMPDFRQLENPKTNFASEIISSDNKVLGNYQDKNHLSISLENSSFAVKENIYSDELILDGEITKTSINYTNQLSDNLTINVNLPIYTFNKGFLDSPIEQWHNFFGLSDGSRVNFPKNQCKTLMNFSPKSKKWSDQKEKGTSLC